MTTMGAEPSDIAFSEVGFAKVLSQIDGVGVRRPFGAERLI
jgi:hypothetical protein